MTIRRAALTLALATAGALATVAPASAAMTPPPSTTCGPAKVCHTTPTPHSRFVRPALPRTPVLYR